MITPRTSPIPSVVPALAILATIVLAAVASRPSVPGPHVARSAATDSAACDFSSTLTFIHARVAPDPATRLAGTAANATMRALRMPRTLAALRASRARLAAELFVVNLKLTGASLAYASYDLLGAFTLGDARGDRDPGRLDPRILADLDQVRALVAGEPTADVFPDGVLDAADLCCILSRIGDIATSRPAPSASLAMR